MLGCMAPRILPPIARLRHLVDQGMTHQAIADLLTQETGYRIARSTVSAALQRAGESSTGKQYPEEVPWVVKTEHQPHYAARMLRLLGRRRRGIKNAAEAEARLDGWLAQLEEAEAVVVYVPDTADGFFYVQGEPDTEGIPVSTKVKI